MNASPSAPFVGFALYARLAHRALFSLRQPGGRMTVGRIARLVRFVPVFFCTQVWNRLCLRLDDFLFPSYRDIEVRDPVFVCGMPRCGTTLLHRVLAQDAQTTSFQLWELLLAPSIIQRRFYRALGRVDRALGGHVKKAVRKQFVKAAGEMQRYHRLDLWEAEEDDLALMPYVATGFLFFPCPYYDLLRPLTRFDDEVPAEVRRHVMARYKELVQRHLFVYGSGKRFLSKNPFMSAKVESIREAFPTARVVYNVRTPHEAVPSMLSLFRFLTGYFNSSTDTPQFVPDNLEIADYFYRHPVERLAAWPEEHHAFVRYPDLTQDLQRTVEELYERLGYPMDEAFREYLATLDGPTRAYKSRHAYSLDEFGLTHADIAERYAAVFETFDFERDHALETDEAPPAPAKAAG